MDVRQAILDELENQDRTIYWLSRHEDLGCNDRTAWGWLKGETDGINVAHIDQMCNILGLSIKRSKLTA